MGTASIVQMTLDSDDCGIYSNGKTFTFMDKFGNQVALSLDAIMRCVSIAEDNGDLPALTKDFWNEVNEILG